MNEPRTAPALMPGAGVHGELDMGALIHQLLDHFVTGYPFHRHIGLALHRVTAEEVSLRIEGQPALIGHVSRQVLHGGVIATLVDVAGAAACLNQALRFQAPAPAEMKLPQGVTVDLHVDYLAPGSGGLFYAQARVLKAGASIYSTRMEVINDAGVMIAAGSGNYLMEKARG